MKGEPCHYDCNDRLIFAELVITQIKVAAAVVNPFLHLWTLKLLQVISWSLSKIKFGIL